jgi:hypothetical protein
MAMSTSSRWKSTRASAMESTMSMSGCRRRNRPSLGTSHSGAIGSSVDTLSRFSWPKPETRSTPSASSQKPSETAGSSAWPASGAKSRTRSG